MIIPEYIILIVTQIAMIFMFLVIFYFTYVKYVEHNSTIDQIVLTEEMIETDLVNSSGNFIKWYDKNISENHKKKIQESLIKSLDDFQKQYIKNNKSTDDSIKKNNSNLEKQSFNYVIFIISLVLFIVLSIMIIGHRVHIFNIIKENTIVLIFIAIIEFVFLMVVIKDYIAINPNIARKTISDVIKNQSLCCGKNNVCIPCNTKNSDISCKKLGDSC